MIALDIQMWYSVHRSQSGLSGVGLALAGSIALVGNNENYYIGVVYPFEGILLLFCFIDL